MLRGTGKSWYIYAAFNGKLWGQPLLSLCRKIKQLKKVTKNNLAGDYFDRPKSYPLRCPNVSICVRI